MTKAAVDAGPQGAVNAIAPRDQYHLNEDYINAMPDQDAFRSHCHHSSCYHTGAPEDVAKLAVFLASEDARFITAKS